MTKKRMHESHRCAACEYRIRGKEYFNFRKCLNDHGRWAHRLCKNCWWKIIIPFSEEVHLRCPGCLKDLPLWHHPKEKARKMPNAEYVELLDDDDD